MQNEPLVSVVVPVYNLEKYIVRCLESISNQTYSNIEVLVVDDGSKDNSLNICEEYAKKDSRVNVIHQENKGLSAARNTGKRNSSGDFICFVDGDDFWTLDMLESMVKASNDYNADLVSCDLAFYYGGKVEKTGTGEVHVLSKTDAMKRLFGEDLYTSACAKMYRSDLWENLEYPEDIKYSEDMYVSHLLIDRTNVVVHIDSGMYQYSQETVSITRNAFSEKRMNMFYASENWVAFCKEKYPECVGEAIKYYHMVFLDFFRFFAELEDKSMYHSYQSRLRKEMSEFQSDSLLSKKDKFKAILLSVSTPGMYRIERKFMGK